MPEGIIKYIIIITVILLVVVLSQHNFLGQWGNKKASELTAPAQNMMTKGASWVNGNIAAKISGEVEKRGDMIKQGVDEQKKNSENILEKTKNYFSEVGNSILHPGNPQNCPPAQTSSGSSANP